MRFPDLENKIAVVTGALGGIGSAVCSLLRANGVRVFGTDIRPDGDPDHVAGNIAEPAFAQRLVDHTLARAGRIDLLINNAGICPRTDLFDISPREWHDVLDVNLGAVFFLSQAVLRVMIPNRTGAIVNLASMAGKVGGIAVGAHYSASKAAIQCLTKTLSRTGAPHGIRVNAVAPGVIDTDITRAATPQQRQGFVNSVPLGRIGNAHEVALPILFLASNAASYITGATLDINGGLLMD